MFDIASNAFTKLVDEKRSQSILVSGESGAGKTEATKQVLQYLAEVAGSASSGVEQKILLANPILEAFGNAKTLRNNNSSRFGKWIEIQFDPRARICGAKIENYLLEKSRVVYQTKGERNYHIFYMLLAGASQEQKDKYYLAAPDYFRYTNQSGCIDIPHVDDRGEFLDMLNAMRQLEFTEQEIDSCLQIVAGILYLGNLDFSGTDTAHLSNPDVAAVAAHLLQVPADALAHAVTTRIMVIPGQAPTSIPLSTVKAYDAANALAKGLYGNLFDWLVMKINQATANRANQVANVIGVLDIFGFEIFDTNSFEQLCINFANEKLQQHFNASTFKLEEQLYQAEGVQFKHVEFIDNQPVLDLIEKRPIGILFLADEETVVPKGTDESFLGKLHGNHDGKHPNYKKPLRPPNAFHVLHYAGEVCYTVDGFLEKNKDALNENLLQVIQKSSLKLIQTLFAAAGAAAAGTSARKSSLGNQFRGQLQALMTTLGATDPHYIRCIKPNQNKLPHSFDAAMILQQLRYAGVFEAVRIRKTGYPFRYTHEEFAKRYRLLAKHVLNKGDYKTQCQNILKAIKGNMSELQIGKTRVLYRAGPHRTLELQRSVAQHYAVRKIQRIVKRWLRDKALRDILAAYFGGNPGPYLAEMKQVLNDLADAVERFNVEGMDYNIARAEELNLGEFESVVSAREYRDYLYWLNNEAYEATEDLDRPRMEAALQNFQTIKCYNAYRDKLEELLERTPKDKFLQLQLKLATKKGDTARATNVTIEIKDAFFKANGDMFTLDKYEGWRTLDSFAKAKLMGREELKMTMKVNTKKPIPTSLTRLAPGPQVATAVKMFKNLLGFSGERAYAYPTVLLQEIVQTGMESSALAEEIYVQIIKQLTRNPTRESVEKCWAAMKGCISYFAPPHGFANFLEMYLRTNNAALVPILHETLYGKKKKTPPSVEELAERLGS